MPGLSEADGPFSIIIPCETVKVATKTKEATIQMSALGSGKYILGSVIFTPIDGIFPDTDRIFPKRDSNFDSTVAHYDFDLLSKCQMAMRTATGTKCYYRIQNSSTGLMFRENDTFPRCAVGALRADRVFANN